MVKPVAGRVAAHRKFLAGVSLFCVSLLPPGHSFGQALPAALPMALPSGARPEGIVKQDIFTTASFPACHASTVVELKNGDWLAAWFGGTAEGKPDVAIWSSRHTRVGWSAPALLVREPQIASWNPVLFHTRDGRLWLFYKFGPVAAGWTGSRMVSTDDGRSWSKPEHLPAGILGPIRAKPYVAPDETVVSGSSVESYHAWAAWIERSSGSDMGGGKTFQKIGPFTLPDSVIESLAKPNETDATIGKIGPEQTTGLIQPTVVALHDGKPGRHLRFYARSSFNIGRIVVADSYDEGKTWTAPHPLDVPNPNSGIDVVVIKDGRVVLIYNPTTQGRSPLALAVSADGLHFRRFATLEDTPGQEFSYPALIQLQNGNLLATYTWHRTRIREALIPLATVPQP
jgi:predicted neuraminidase